MPLNHPKRILLGTGAYYDAAEMDLYIAEEKVDIMVQCLNRAIYLCESRKCPEAAKMFKDVLGQLQGKEEG
jgi:hypothetical protein